MSLSSHAVRRDKFELDCEEHSHLAFPCNVCIHRYNTDREEPCRTCDHNVCAVSDALLATRTETRHD